MEQRGCWLERKGLIFKLSSRSIGVGGTILLVEIRPPFAPPRGGGVAGVSQALLSRLVSALSVSNPREANFRLCELVIVLETNLASTFRD